MGNKPDAQALTYLECASSDFDALHNYEWYLNDARLLHEAQGIAFQIEDLLNKVRNRLNEEEK